MRTKELTYVTLILCTFLPILSAGTIFQKFDPFHRLTFYFFHFNISPFKPAHWILYFTFLFSFQQLSFVMAIAIINGLIAATSLKFWLQYAVLYSTRISKNPQVKIFRCERKHNIAPNNMNTQIYRIFQIYYSRFNETYGSIVLGCHHLALYGCFVLILYLAVRVQVPAVLAFMGICIFCSVIGMEFVESHFTDSSLECAKFIRIMKSTKHLPALSRLRSRGGMSTIRMHLAAGFFFCDRGFLLTFLHSGVNHVIALLMEGGY